MTDDSVTAHGRHEDDDLEAIAGIGPEYAKALTAIGIRTFADLARYDSAETLRQKLLEMADKDVPVSKIVNGDWIGRAASLAADQKANSNRPVQVDEVSHGKTLVESHAAKGQLTWHQYAGFSVFFDYVADENGEQSWQNRVWQTRVYHDESGDEGQFPGTVASSWANWILVQAEVPLVDSWGSQEDIEPSDEEPYGILYSEPQAIGVPLQSSTRLEISRVMVDETAPNLDVPERHLQAQIQFRIVGAEAEELVAQGLPLRMELHTVSIDEGVSSLVASARSQLQPRVFEYTNRQAFPIPEIGRYRLYCVALLLPPGNLADYHEGPIINIVS